MLSSWVVLLLLCCWVRLDSTPCRKKTIIFYANAGKCKVFFPPCKELRKREDDTLPGGRGLRTGSVAFLILAFSHSSRSSERMSHLREVGRNAGRSPLRKRRIMVARLRWRRSATSSGVRFMWYLLSVFQCLTSLAEECFDAPGTVGVANGVAFLQLLVLVLKQPHDVTELGDLEQGV